MAWQPPTAPTAQGFGDPTGGLDILALLRQIAAATPKNPLAGSIQFGPSQWTMPQAAPLLGNESVPLGSPAVPVGPQPGAVLPTPALPASAATPVASPAAATGGGGFETSVLGGLLKNVISPKSGLGALLGIKEPEPTPIATPTPVPTPQAPASTTRTFTFGGPKIGYYAKLFGTESGGDPNAQNSRSSAGGLGQFIDSTWIDLLRRNRPDLAEGRTDAQLIALKKDPQLSTEMSKVFTGENEGQLRSLGIPVNDANRYAAHFLGATGAAKLLTADPSTPIRNIVGDDAYKANLRNGKFVYGETAGDVVANIQKRFGTEDTLGGSPTGMPAAPTFTAAQLPGAPTLQAPVGADPTKYLEDLARARPKGVETPDPTQRLLEVLAGAAQGAGNARNLGDLLAGAGGGAAGAAAGNTKEVIARRDRQEEALRQFQLLMANAGLTAEQMRAANKNLGIETANKNLMLQDQRGVTQAELDARARDKTTETGFNYGVELGKLAMPQVHVSDEDNRVSVTQRDPRTGAVTVQTDAGGAPTLKAIKAMEGLVPGGKDNPAFQQGIYSAMQAKFGGQGVQDTMLYNLVRQGGWRDLIGDPKEVEKFKKLVDEGLPPGTSLQPKGKEQWDDRAVAILRGRLSDPMVLTKVVQTLATKYGDPFAKSLIGGQ